MCPTFELGLRRRTALQVTEGCRQLQSLLDSGAFAAAAAGAISAEGQAANGSSCGGSASNQNGSSSSTVVPWEALFRLLSDARRLETDPRRLPATGYGPEFEEAASGIFVQASLVDRFNAAAAGAAGAAGFAAADVQLSHHAGGVFAPPLSAARLPCPCSP
jgi:hypothetical protein